MWPWGGGGGGLALFPVLGAGRATPWNTCGMGRGPQKEGWGSGRLMSAACSLPVMGAKCPLNMQFSLGQLLAHPLLEHSEGILRVSSVAWRVGPADPAASVAPHPPTHPSPLEKDPLPCLRQPLAAPTDLRLREGPLSLQGHHESAAEALVREAVSPGQLHPQRALPAPGRAIPPAGQQPPAPSQAGIHLQGQRHLRPVRSGWDHLDSGGTGGGVAPAEPALSLWGEGGLQIKHLNNGRGGALGAQWESRRPQSSPRQQHLQHPKGPRGRDGKGLPLPGTQESHCQADLAGGGGGGGLAQQEAASWVFVWCRAVSVSGSKAKQKPSGTPEAVFPLS